MSDIQFDEGPVGVVTRHPKAKKKTFADRLIGWGLAKDEAQANLWLIGVIVVGFGLIIYLNMNTFGSPADSTIIDDPALNEVGA